MALVVDASMAVAWFIASQATPYTDSVLERAAEGRLHVPPLLHVEFASVLVKLMHRRKIKPDAIGSILDRLEALDLVTDRAPPTARTIAALCRQHSLSAYDATYFELASRLGVPLAAKDAALARIAKKAGILLA